MRVSRLIAELLQEHMRAQTTYEDAMRRYLARAPIRSVLLGCAHRGRGEDRRVRVPVDEDLQHGAELEGLRVVNPFRVAAGSLA
jgi:hypothetical protein